MFVPHLAGKRQPQEADRLLAVDEQDDPRLARSLKGVQLGLASGRGARSLDTGQQDHEHNEQPDVLLAVVISSVFRP